MKITHIVENILVSLNPDRFISSTGLCTPLSVGGWNHLEIDHNYFSDCFWWSGNQKITILNWSERDSMHTFKVSLIGSVINRERTLHFFFRKKVLSGWFINIWFEFSRILELVSCVRIYAETTGPRWSTDAPEAPLRRHWLIFRLVKSDSIVNSKTA